MSDLADANHAPPGGQTSEIDALALQGHDPVAYVVDGSARKGREEICHVHEGRLYRFASADHRARFIEDPQRFLPQYGGFCALGIAEGHKAPSDPAAFAVIDGKLYLSYDRETATEWRRDAAGNIAKADVVWRGIGNSPVEK